MESKLAGLWFKNILNGMRLMSTLYAYSLQPVLINQRCSKYTHSYTQISNVLMSSEKSIHLLIWSDMSHCKPYAFSPHFFYNVAITTKAAEKDDQTNQHHWHDKCYENKHDWQFDKVTKWHTGCTEYHLSNTSNSSGSGSGRV